MIVKPCIALLFALICALLPAQSQRLNQTLNAGWAFQQGDSVETDAWQDISIPHTWNIADVYDDQKGYYRGVGWYQLTIDFPDSASQNHHELFFEGVNQVADIYLNEKWIGAHRGGFTGFAINLTKNIQYGKKNTLLVKVDNSYHPDIPPTSFDFNVQGGIYRDVRLISTHPTYFVLNEFAGSGVKVTTPIVTNQEALIKVQSKISFGSKTQSIVLNHQLKYADQEVASIKKNFRKKDFGSSQTLELQVKTPNLWRPDNPHLYRLTSTITDTKSGKILDELTTPVGLRRFEMNPQKGFYLNGERIKLIGASRHQDFQGMGSAIPDSYQIRDIELLKEMGANFLRTATYSQDPAVLEACDRLGIIVWEEIPVVDRVTPSIEFAQNSERMLKEMINQHGNHPSIFMWGFMNEILLGAYEKELSDEEQKEVLQRTTILAQKLNKVCKEVDPNRLTAIANQKNFKKYEDNGLLTITDIVGWNIYYGWYSSDISRTVDFLEDFHEKYPNQGVLISEFGAGSDTRIHSDKPERFDFSMEWQQYVHEEYLKIILGNEWLIGAAIWNLVDFSSEGRQDAMPNINSKGLLTHDRKYKDVYFLYKSALSNEPVVRIASHDWDIRTATSPEQTFTQPIKVYTNQPIVELFLNGQSLGRKTRKNNYTLMWDVPFTNGKNTLYAKSDLGADDFVSVDFHLIKIPFDASFTSLNVNCGSHDDFIEHHAHTVWIADQPYEKGGWGYIGGEPYTIWNGYRNGSDKNILKTDLDPIYQTQRLGADRYQFDLPEGTYSVALHFAELNSKKPEEKLLYNLENETEVTITASRVFDVIINGLIVSPGLDLENEFGTTAAVIRTYEINVKEKGLSIAFESTEGQAVINAISIQKVY